jgi:hypothetical protein
MHNDVQAQTCRFERGVVGPTMSEKLTQSTIDDGGKLSGRSTELLLHIIEILLGHALNFNPQFTELRFQSPNLCTDNVIAKW